LRKELDGEGISDELRSWSFAPLHVQSSLVLVSWLVIIAGL